MSFALEEATDRGPRRQYAVLMGCLYNPPRPGLHKDRLRERLSLREATEFMRGLLVGFKLGSGRMLPGLETMRHLKEGGK